MKPNKKSWERIFDFILCADIELVSEMSSKKMNFETFLKMYKDKHYEKHGKKFSIRKNNKPMMLKN